MARMASQSLSMIPLKAMNGKSGLRRCLEIFRDSNPKVLDGFARGGSSMKLEMLKLTRNLSVCKRISQP